MITWPPIRLVTLLLALAVVPCACDAELKPDTQQVPMQDGTKLVTDVYLPAGDGPWPVILMRSTYGRMGGHGDLLEQGYAVVVQDVRGMGQSEGEAFVFQADGWHPGLTDGADTVAWLLAQPWCNGHIGTQGGSALAITQMLLAPSTGGLDAQSLEVGAASMYHHMAYQGGVFLKNMLEGWLTAIKQPHIIPVYKAHPTYDDFWRFYDCMAKAPNITAPGLFVGGWYDIFQQGTLDAFTSREYEGGDGARGRNYLIMKWSGHGPDKDFDYALKENRFDLKLGEFRRAFFDANLKGDAHALDGWAKVNYYVMGDDRDPKAPGNEWRTAETWPPFDTKPVEFYLRADSLLDRYTPQDAAAKLGYTFDPANPVPTHGGPNLLIPYGPYDQRKAREGRTDVLVFATAPLDVPLEVTGRVKLRLFVSSDAPDTDFTAKLVDVYPSGDDREINVTEGVQRVKLRNSLETPEPLLTGPNQVVELEIDLWSASWIFNKKHRVGLHVSSSNYPRFELNPNTGADFPKDGEPMRQAFNAVHLGPGTPSALLLPLRP